MSRVLLEADNPDIFRQEIQQAFGTVHASRKVVKDLTNATVTLTTIPIDGQLVRVRSLIMARQVDGSNNCAAWEMYGTFKNVNGVLSQVDTTDFVHQHEDDNDWGVRYELFENVLYLQSEFNGATNATGLHIVFNVYSFLHTLKDA